MKKEVSTEVIIMNKSTTYIILITTVLLVVSLIISTHSVLLERKNTINTTTVLSSGGGIKKEKMMLFKNISLHFDGLMSNSYYVFTHNGLKYVKLPPYVPDYPGYHVFSLEINESFHNITLYFVLETNNILEYGISIIIKHSNYSYSYKGVILDNETYIKLDPPEKFYGNYIAYLRGFIRTGNREDIDIQLYIYIIS